MLTVKNTNKNRIKQQHIGSLRGKLILAYDSDGRCRTGKVVEVSYKKQLIKILIGRSVSTTQQVSFQSFIDRINQGSLLWWSNSFRKWRGVSNG